MNLPEGILRYECINAAICLGLKKDQYSLFVHIVQRIYDLLIAYDLTLVEINPLVVTKSGKLICIDAKINIDDNALYRQPKLRQMRDLSQEDERESQAKKWELNYISLKGNIGCMVNGAEHHGNYGSDQVWRAAHPQTFLMLVAALPASALPRHSRSFYLTRV